MPNKISLTSASSRAISSTVRKANELLDNFAKDAANGIQTKVSDNVAGFAIGTRLQTQVVAMKQAEINIRQSKSMLSTAEGGVSLVLTSLQRMKSLAVQSASADLSDSDRQSLDFELQQQKSEISRIAASTNFNGKLLLNGVIENKGNRSALSGNSLDTSGTTVANGDILLNTKTDSKARKYKIDDRGAGIAKVAFAADSVDAPIAVSYQNTAENIGILRVRNIKTNQAEDVTINGPIATGTTRDIKFDELGVTITLDDRFSVGSGKVNDFANLKNDFGERIVHYNIQNGATGAKASNILPNLAGLNNNIKITATHGNLSGIVDGSVTVNTAAAATSSFTMTAKNASGGANNFTSVATADLTALGAKTVTLRRANGSGYDSITFQFTVNTVLANADAIGFNLNQLQQNTVDTINNYQTSGAGTLTANSAGQNNQIKILSTSGEIYGITSTVATFDTSTASSSLMTLPALARDGVTAANFTNNTTISPIDLTATGLKTVALSRVDPVTNEVDTINVQFNVSGAFSNSDVLSVDLKQLNNPLVVTNNIIRTSSTGQIRANTTNLNDVGNDNIKVIGTKGRIDRLTTGSLEIGLFDDATNGTLTIGAQSQSVDSKGKLLFNNDGSPTLQTNNFTATGINLTQTGMQQVTLKRQHLDDRNKYDEITVQFDITTAFVAGDGTATGGATATTLVALNQLKHLYLLEHNVSGGAELKFQVGITEKETDRITLTLQGLTSEQLGFVDSDNILTADAANALTSKIDTAISNALDRLARIGSTSNRLDGAANNLSVSVENFQAAQDTLLAIDMTEVVTQYSETSLKLQTSISMLAKQNTVKEFILQLLR